MNLSTIDISEIIAALATIVGFTSTIDATDIIATVAAVIAVISAIIAYRSASATGKHNKLSIKPHLETHTATDQNFNQDSGIFTCVVDYYLSNKGLGPGFLKSFSLTYKGKIFKINKSCEWENLVEGLIPYGIQHDIKLKAFPGKNGAIDVKENFQLMKIEFTTNSDQAIHELNQVIDDCRVRIEFDSIYHDEIFVFEGSVNETSPHQTKLEIR